MPLPPPPPATPSHQQTVSSCYRHPNRPAGRQCTRCGKCKYRRHVDTVLSLVVPVTPPKTILGPDGKPVQKTEEEIDLIRASALVLAKAHGEVAGLVKEGVTTRQLDKRAEEFIRDHGGIPSFKGYNKFPFSLCLSPNSVVVHGFATDKPLKSGDILSVDCGVLLNGYHADSAYTYAIGEVSAEVRQDHRDLIAGRALVTADRHRHHCDQRLLR